MTLVTLFRVNGIVSLDTRGSIALTPALKTHMDVDVWANARARTMHNAIMLLENVDARVGGWVLTARDLARLAHLGPTVHARLDTDFVGDLLNNIS